MDKSIASKIRELLGFLSTAKGDLANVTGPPAMLAPLSVTEVVSCWAERPDVFAAAALESDPARRCLMVLRLFLISLRTQLYIGGSPTTSIRKPLNAFLGELFFAEWVADSEEDGGSNCSRTSSRDGLSRSTTSTASSVFSTVHTQKPGQTRTRLVTEQVCHHPPITATHVSDIDHGVRADGYARVEMTFNGNVNVRQIGHALYHIDAYDEDYLLPLPDVRVRGFLTGRLYPEIVDTLRIVSTSGFSAEIKFSGQGLAWGGKRNAFSATVIGPDKTVHFSADGTWSQGWTVKAHAGKKTTVIETFDHDDARSKPAPIVIAPLDEQDPWETRRAWAGVHEGLRSGNMSQTVAEKSRIEQAQRKMRAREAANKTTWTPLLFKNSGPASDATAAAMKKLAAAAGVPLNDDRSKGVWRVDDDKVQGLQRPIYGDLTPVG